MSVVIDLDALLDLRCLQFCVARTSQYLDNSEVTSLAGTPLFTKETRQNIQLQALLPCTRPRIHAFSLLTALRKAHRPVKVFSFVEESVVNSLLIKFPWVPNPSAYVSLESYLSPLQILVAGSGTVLVHLPHVAANLQAHGVSSVCIPVSKHQGLPLRSLLTAVPGFEAETIEEYSQWKGHVKLKAPVRLSGTVVHGFGKGSSELGFPTANIVPEQSRVNLVPGVYCGRVTLEGHSQPFKAAISIGWCPHYGDREKTTEIHILHRFEQPFYGQRLTVQLEAYLRAESVFSSVAELIQAINYDVRLTEELIDS